MCKWILKKNTVSSQWRGNFNPFKNFQTEAEIEKDTKERVSEILTEVCRNQIIRLSECKSRHLQTHAGYVSYTLRHCLRH